MSISLAAIITAYDALGTLNATTISTYATLIGLGNRPTYPVDVAADADYNSVTTSIATWDASYATDNAAYRAAVAAQVAQELVVTNLMQPNQWFKMTGLANWGAHATQYIGIRNNKTSNADNLDGATLYTIQTSRTLPANPFPNV